MNAARERAQAEAWIRVMDRAEAYATAQREVLLPCPFCGGTDLEVEHTHTASYWVECACRAQVHGKAYAKDRRSRDITFAQYARAIRSAVERWNTRRSPTLLCGHTAEDACDCVEDRQ